MPSHMPSSFASAAAGSGANRDSRNGRGDGRGSGDWNRKEKPTNGTGTAVFRRSSTTPFAPSSSHADAPPTLNESTQPSMHNPSSGSRYTREEMLEIQKNSRPNRDISRLLAEKWDPENSNGTNGQSRWATNNDGRNNGADICWNKNGDTQPLGHQEMSDQEKSLFANDVNSPIKQITNKDTNAQGGGTGRKTSISHSQASAGFGLSSPASSRPGTRRQQTSDSISGMQSPGFMKGDNGGLFSRKIESKDGAEDDKPTPFNLMRSNTGGILGNAPGSPSTWGPPSATAAMSPMGSFGNLGMGNPGTPIDKRPPFASRESRFFTTKESTEDMSSKAADKSWRSGRQRTDTTDTDPFSGEAPSGSAALGGGRDSSPPPQPRASGLDTPVRGMSSDFGMSNAQGFHDTFGRGQTHQTPQGRQGDREPMSPSETNPYRSPADNERDGDDESYEEENLSHGNAGLGGIPEHVTHAFGNVTQGFANMAINGSDRSQTSSVGASRPFPQFGGVPALSGLGGWPTSNPASTQAEHRPAFPSGIFGTSFGPSGELQSPGGFGIQGGVFGGGSMGAFSGPDTIGRGSSRLTRLLPEEMQAQMQRSDEHGDDMRHPGTYGAIGRGVQPPSRDTDSPMRTSRFEDMLAQSDNSRSQSTAENPQGQTSTAFASGNPAQAAYQQSQASSDSASNQMPNAQVRGMVMPDRMRWVYLDPQGQVQGPWSGLEMHDWYKASFFTPDLSVKKVEDQDFEPLGQLIRRIGNSREPFLVPQIGIAHGPAPAPSGPPFTPAVATQAGQPGAVQPPFANSFPSFGTTLTAEQQNNLERRKQEEQFLMARQREFLAQQQVNMKQMQMSGMPSALHHHSSAHSLQSQPSFGSMTSPIGMPPQPPMHSVSGFFEPPRPMPAQQPSGIPADFFREEELARLSYRDRQQVLPVSHPANAQHITSMFNQPEQRQEPIHEEEDPEGHLAKLHQFQEYRRMEDELQTMGNAEPIGPPQPQQREEEFQPPQEQSKSNEPEVLSLTQQVQKAAASAKQSPIPSAQPDSPWAKVNTGLPMPFPPPQSTTPLPAPMAQRDRSNIPEALHMEARSRSETPEISSATPSLAPWAKEQVEGPKGPSLKEIQEAEAKTAAKAEEAAAAARRVQHDMEMKLLASQPTAPAPGLPTSSTWGNSASPATPTGAPSPWSKPAAKAPSMTTSAASKKSLAEIQRDEELRKQKLAAAAAASQPTVGLTGGKRYADLASKVTPGVPAIGSAWSTVGAGGKVKIPTGPAITAPQATRTVSSAAIPAASAPRMTRPNPAVRSVTTTGQSSTNTAKDEFNKWCKAALTNNLSPGIHVDGFIDMLKDCPADLQVISEVVYSNSQLLNGRDFATEYIRRRNQAQKGVIELAGSAANDKSGGWSEVAKKGPPKEEPTAGFKVVPNKKKGKK